MHEFFLFVILVTLIGCSIPLLKIWTDRNKSSVADEEVETLHHEIAALRDRVETLERIVTDEKYALKQEFDALPDTNGAVGRTVS